MDELGKERRAPRRRIELRSPLRQRGVCASRRPGRDRAGRNRTHSHGLKSPLCRPLHHGSEAEGGRVELPRALRCARRFSRPRPAPAVGWSFPIRAARVERAASPVGAGRSDPAELRAVSGQGRARTCDLPGVGGALIPLSYSASIDGRTWDRTRGLSHVTRALIPLSYASGSRGVRSRTRAHRRWKPGGLPEARPSVVGVTGGTRTRAAGLTTPNAARYTTVTVASAGIEPAWRRRMKPAEPQALPAVGYQVRPAGFEPASSAVAGRCSSVLSYGRQSVGRDGVEPPQPRGGRVTAGWARQCPVPSQVVCVEKWYPRQGSNLRPPRSKRGTLLRLSYGGR